MVMPTSLMSLRHFLNGLGVCVCVYALLFVYGLFINTPHIDEDKTLSYETVKFQTSEISVRPLSDPNLASKRQTDASTHSNDVPLGSGIVLSASPSEAVSELYSLTNGYLPKRTDNGLRPFDVYRRPAPSDITAKKIAIVFHDFGMSDTLTQLILEHTSSKHATFLISPYATDAQAIQDQSRQAGYETWLHVPLQNAGLNSFDGGPAAISANKGVSSNQAALYAALSKFHGYSGIAIDVYQLNSLAIEPMLKTIANDIFSRGLGYLDLNAKAPDVFRDIATSGQYPYARPVTVSLQSFQEHLDAGLRMADLNGEAVIVIEPDEFLPNAYKTWVDILNERDISLVPLSSIAETKIDL